MKSVLQTLGSAMVALAVLGGMSWADEAQDAQKPAALTAAFEAGAPGAEHNQLEPLVGTWTYTCKAYMDPSQPPVETTGTIERRWVLGGRFLEETIEGTGFDGQPGFEGRGLIGYDKVRQKYTSTFVCNMSTGECSGVGVLESPGKLTFQTKASCPMHQKVIAGREEIRIESDDRMVMESYHTIAGQEVKSMEIVATRKR